MKVSIRENEAIPRIARMIKSMGHKIELFNAHCNGRTRVEKSEEAALDVLIYLVLFCTDAITFFHDHTGPSALSHEDDWQELIRIYKSTTSDIDDTFQRVEKLAQLAKLNAHSSEFEMIQQFLSSPTPSSTSMAAASLQEEASLPCIILPRTFTTQCYDRGSILADIEAHFDTKSESRTFCSLALWGLGGVGKSHVALKYAKSKVDDFDAIFWIHSEGQIALAESFSSIAVRLQLPNTNPQNHEGNRVSVLNWLQKTPCRWLLIFDNGNDENDLLEYWPVAARGYALITTRNHNLAFQPADTGIEVFPFKTAEGSAFLLHLLSLDIVDNLTEKEAKSAFDLSERLSGNALAISQMAGLIHRRSVLSYVSPDSIPQVLFSDSSTLGPSLEIYQDELKFSEVQEVLLNLSLIRRDKSSRTFSLHRLVQTQFRFYLSAEARQQVFEDASMILNKAFPPRNAGKSQYYDRWAVCRLYLQHVLSIKDNYKKDHAGTDSLHPCPEFCWALVNCGRYMMEIASFTELEDVAAVATQAFKALDTQKQDSELSAKLSNLSGVMWAHRGQFRKSEEYLKRALAIRTEQKPDNLDEKSWAYTDLGNCVSSLNRHDEALRLHEKAEELRRLSTDQLADRFTSLELRIEDGRLSESTAVGNQNIGRTLRFLGRLEDAHARLKLAMGQLKVSENFAMIAYTRFVIASTFRAEQKLEKAKAEYIAAQEAWLQGGKLQTHHFNSVCIYKLGCVAFEQGKYEDAVTYLHQALVVAKLQSVAMAGIYARVLYKLSQVLRKAENNLLEADEKRYEAESILMEQKASLGIQDDSGEEAYDSLVYILWRPQELMGITGGMEDEGREIEDPPSNCELQDKVLEAYGWATVTKLTESDDTLSIDRYSKNIVVDVLNQQRQLLLKFGRLDGRLQPLANTIITEEQDSQNTSNRDARQGPQTEETLDSWFPDAGELLGKCVTFVRQTSKFPGQLRWAISDKKATEELLKRLSELNDYLCELLNAHQWEMLVARQVRTDYMIVQLNNKLDHLQEIVEAGLAHNLTAASRADRRPLKWGGDVRPGAHRDSEHSRHLTSLAQFKALGSALETDSLTDEYAQKLDLGESVQDITSCELSWDDIQLLPHATPISNDQRTEAWYNSNLGRDRRVWVEWKPGDGQRPNHNTHDRKIIGRFEALVALLRENQRTEQFRAVPCLGYIRTRPSREDHIVHFGLVFKNPSGVALSERPVSLFELFQDTKSRVPSLTARFALAKDIVQCVEKLHAVNWLHKGLRSDNLLLYETREGTIDLSKSYLSGFDYARPAHRKDMTERTVGNVLHDLYRHPQVQGFIQDDSQGRRYKKRHDIYSLGILLLEITYWESIDSILGFRNLEDIRPSEVAMLRGKLLSGRYLDHVQSCMGDNMYGAIRACLQGMSAFGISDDADETDVFVGARLQAKF
ncbi:uncharacterized protein LY89DRAFT_782305 [Mollisia scopiformis]|uniref:Protein kinase domain-containing protein n=1 Tax=Mollisia scopiformis TaxID=149040 RepID=A0A194XBH1_MOLSC|nr:uncharacterized protein LY89DRAFT_782305 [Mollisia scopiformis]KUJ17107.1 hypothetical protein LY89DRAFT_782305 [Mollisia scopiformis]